MPKPKPIPAELLDRLAALDRRCDISMVRGTYHRSFAHKPARWVEGPGTPTSLRSRRWTVVIVLQGGRRGDVVTSVEPALADALLYAVTDAEGRGWDKA